MSKTVTRRTAGQRMLHCGYADILRLIINKAGNATWRDVAVSMGTGRASSQNTLRWLAYFGVVQVAGWTHCEGYDKRVIVPRYGFGLDGHTPHPGYTKGKGSPTNPADRPGGTLPVELMTFCNAIKALQADSFHAKGLASEVGMSARTAQVFVRHLRGLKLLHAVEYEVRTHGGVGFPYFAFGVDKKDKPKPAPLTKQEIWTRHNANKAARRRTARLIGLQEVKRISKVRDIGMAVASNQQAMREAA